MSPVAVAAVACALAAIAGILLRPWRTPEWVWAVGAALAMLALRVVTPSRAAAAVADGFDVYLFLIGVMLLAELARGQGVFAWLAAAVLETANGSRSRLFVLLYAVGVAVTALLSNDTTAVVLTPAVIAVLARTDARPLPYLYACAFVANAASFLLPIGNPANLVVFAEHLPALAPWLTAFAFSSIAAIVVTFAVLRLVERADLRGRFSLVGEPVRLSPAGRTAAVAIALAIAALLLVNAFGGPVGATALVAGLLAVAVVGIVDRGTPAYVAKHTTWGVVPLVAGLFVVVAGLDRAGALGLARLGLHTVAALAAPLAHLATGAVVTLACAIFNNLPVALFSASALRAAPPTPALAHAVLVAVDLGPNLCTTGSLATLLWLVALRREGINVTPIQFLRLGAIVTAPALAVAMLLVR